MFIFSVTPLDVVKVRLQGQLKGNSNNFISATEAFLKILKQEGWISLYRGFIPTLAMSLPGTVIYFVGYEKIKEKLNDLEIKEEFVPLLSGSFSRIISATFVTPLELIRTRMQFKGIEHGKFGIVSAELWRSVQSEGFKTLLRGLQPTLWRDVPFSAIYWTILEPTKRFIMKRLKLISNTKDSTSDLANTFVSFGCGAFAGAIAAALTTPFDVAKTRQQTLLNRTKLSPSSLNKISKCPSSTWLQLKEIWREERWKGLTKGMGPRVAKVAPACAIMIGSYEFGKAMFSIK